MESGIREIKKQSAEIDIEVDDNTSPNEFLERCERIAKTPAAKYEVWKTYERERGDRL